MAYKPEQGRLARMAVFWMLWLLIIYGCVSFRYEMDNWGWLPEAMRSHLFSLPVIGEVTWNVLISLIGIPLITAWLLIRYLNKPKYADFLIEVETELRKVAWPTFVETRGAAIVVIISVLILMAFLAGADLVLSRLVQNIWSMTQG